MAKLYQWLQLLHILANEFSDLRYIELGWGANCEFPWQLELGAEERGLGDRVGFVHALAQIHGLLLELVVMSVGLVESSFGGAGADVD